MTKRDQYDGDGKRIRSMFDRWPALGALTVICVIGGVSYGLEQLLPTTYVVAPVVISLCVYASGVGAIRSCHRSLGWKRALLWPIEHWFPACTIVVSLSVVAAAFWAIDLMH